MKPALAAAMLVAVAATPALAISRHNTDGMSCSQTQATVRKEGAVILRYASKRNPGMTLYGRYVRHGLFCASHEVAQWAWIPTADDNTCRVLECKAPDKFDFDILKRR
jgi:hypothetical protein